MFRRNKRTRKLGHEIKNKVDFHMEEMAVLDWVKRIHREVSFEDVLAEGEMMQISDDDHFVRGYLVLTIGELLYAHSGSEELQRMDLAEGFEVKMLELQTGPAYVVFGTDMSPEMFYFPHGSELPDRLLDIAESWEG